MVKKIGTEARKELERFFDQLDSAVVADDRARVQSILEGSRITASAAQVVDFIGDSTLRHTFRASAVAATRGFSRKVWSTSQ